MASLSRALSSIPLLLAPNTRVQVVVVAASDAAVKVVENRESLVVYRRVEVA